MTSSIHTWGIQPHERLLAFPCSRIIPGADQDLYRGITIQARPEVVFRWLCQMRIAPYSYDWIDNLGRQSPRRWTPGLEQLAIGQKVMRDFELVDFAVNEQLTLQMKSALLGGIGDVAVTYLVVAGDAGSCRLLVKLSIRYRPGVAGWLARQALPLGDLVMMRRQLQNFKKLAEQTNGELTAASTTSTGPGGEAWIVPVSG